MVQKQVVVLYLCMGSVVENWGVCVCSGVFSVCLLMLKGPCECAHAGQCESQLVLPSAFESEGGLVPESNFIKCAAYFWQKAIGSFKSSLAGHRWRSTER